MTTISPRRKKTRFSASAFLGAAVLAAVAVGVIVWRPYITGLFWTFAAPLASFRNSLDATDNARLRAELASTTAALADRNALYQQNRLLKAQFGADAGAHMLLAGVLQHPPGTPYDTLIIDAGQQSGVTKGALVSAGGGAYIGTISDVYTSSSRVTLFSTPGATYNATLLLSTQAGTSVPISLVGEGAGDMSAQVPASTPVSTGDAVMVPGINTAFAGSVSYIEQPAGSSFETLHIHLPVDLFSLQFVEVRAPL